MIVRFPQKMSQFIDNEGFRIVELIEEIPEPPAKPWSPTGSSAHEIPNDLSDRMDDSAVIWRDTHFNKTVAIGKTWQGRSIGLSEERYKPFKKLVNAILKERTVSNHVEFDFVESAVFDWLTTTYEMKRANGNLSTYLLDKVDSAIEEIKVHYWIPNLSLSRPFQIGNVRFEYFTKEYFDQLAAQFEASHPTTRENPYKDSEFRKRYQGKVYATYIAKTEAKRAQTIALEKCALAVDVLKMFSETIDVPEIKLSFDIDRRLRESLQSEIITTTPSKDMDSFAVTINILPNRHRIDDLVLRFMIHKNIGAMDQFLKRIDRSIPSELERLIIRSIGRLGDAITETNLHQRIVDLFTILESLLLRDQSTPISESVSQYCSKLVAKKSEDRSQIIALLKKLYRVRSTLVHHGIEADFSVEDLKQLQHIVVSLIINLTSRSLQHKTKKSLLHEIDQAILAAY